MRHNADDGEPDRSTKPPSMAAGGEGLSTPAANSASPASLIAALRHGLSVFRRRKTDGPVQPAPFLSGERMTVAALWQRAPSLDPRRHQHAHLLRIASRRRYTVPRPVALVLLGAAGMAAVFATGLSGLGSALTPATAASVHSLLDQAGRASSGAWISAYGRGWASYFGKQDPGTVQKDPAATARLAESLAAPMAAPAPAPIPSIPEDRIAATTVAGEAAR